MQRVFQHYLTPYVTGPVADIAALRGIDRDTRYNYMLIVVLSGAKGSPAVYVFTPGAVSDDDGETVIVPDDSFGEGCWRAVGLGDGGSGSGVAIARVASTYYSDFVSIWSTGGPNYEVQAQSSGTVGGLSSDQFVAGDRLLIAAEWGVYNGYWEVMSSLGGTLTMQRPKGYRQLSEFPAGTPIAIADGINAAQLFVHTSVVWVPGATAPTFEAAAANHTDIASSGYAKSLKAHSGMSQEAQPFAGLLHPLFQGNLADDTVNPVPGADGPWPGDLAYLDGQLVLATSDAVERWLVQPTHRITLNGFYVENLPTGEGAIAKLGNGSFYKTPIPKKAAFISAQVHGEPLSAEVTTRVFRYNDISGITEISPGSEVEAGDAVWVQLNNVGAVTVNATVTLHFVESGSYPIARTPSPGFVIFGASGAYYWLNACGESDGPTYDTDGFYIYVSRSPGINRRNFLWRMSRSNSGNGYILNDGGGPYPIIGPFRNGMNYIRAVKYNANGESAMAAELSFNMTSSNYQAPPAPTDVSLTSTVAGELVVNFTPGALVVGAPYDQPIGFRAYISRNTGFALTDAEMRVEITDGGVIPGLVPGETYYVRVVAYATGGETAAAEQSVMVATAL